MEKLELLAVAAALVSGYTAWSKRKRLKQRHNDFVKWSENFFLHPWYAAVLTLAILVDGGLASAWGPDLSSTFLTMYNFHNALSIKATFWWLFTGLLAFFFFYRQLASDRQTKRAQERLESSADQASELISKLERLIRTLPPAHFLEQFHLLYQEAYAAFQLAKKSEKRENIEAGLRAILRALASLTLVFDGHEMKRRYAANIMIYKAVSTLPSEQVKMYTEALNFDGGNKHVGGDKGILVLEAALSAYADSDQPDPDMKLLVIRIPIMGKYKNKYTVAPGGPVAFINRVAECVPDTAKIKEWCDTECCTGAQEKDQIVEYFAKTPHVKSFISIPLFDSTSMRKIIEEDLKPADRPDPIGVLNIHCDTAGLLKELAEPRSHFVHVTTPFQIMLAELLEHWVEKGNI